MYDVIVVGAGPAGSTAARYAAEHGARTLLVEKQREIGSPIQCGGFMPKHEEINKLLPNARDTEGLFDYPQSVVLNETRYQRFTSPNGEYTEIPVEGDVIDRRAFDKHLAREAISAGATVQLGTHAKIEGDRVVAGEKEYEARVIIGADGPQSRIARELGLTGTLDPHDMAIGLQYEMAGVDVDPDAVYMCFGNEYAPGGYGWIIPTGENTANVGVGVRRPYMKQGRSMRDYLDAFVESHPILGEITGEAVVTAIQSGVIPAGGPPEETVVEGVLIVGDAAGQVMSTSGGGVALAMIAGRAAGECAAKHALEDAPLEDYEERWRGEMGRELETGVAIRRSMDPLMRSDRLINMIMGLLGPEDFDAVVRGRMPGAVERVLSAYTGNK